MPTNVTRFPLEVRIAKVPLSAPVVPLTILVMEKCSNGPALVRSVRIATASPIATAVVPELGGVKPMPPPFGAVTK